jgi:hypothetical protein
MTTLVSGRISNGGVGRLRIERGYGEFRVKDRCHLESSFQPGRRPFHPASRFSYPAGNVWRRNERGGGRASGQRMTGIGMWPLLLLSASQSTSPVSHNSHKI